MIRLIWMFIFLFYSVWAQDADSLLVGKAIPDSLDAGHDIALPDSGVQFVDTLKSHSDSLGQTSHSYLVDSTRLGEPPVFRTLTNSAFRIGEYLEFDIAYKFITAGTATMSIPDTQWVENRPCYHIVTTAESNAFFSSFYKVRDRVESFIDMQGLFPWKFEKHIHEGRYKANRSVRYDQMNRRVYGHKDTLDVSPYIQGVLSSFYFVRTLPLEVGKSIDIENYGDGKVYPLRILVHRKEKVKVPAGKFKCIVIEPVLKTEGIFNQTGKLTIWLTDDERKIPVLMKSKIMVGSIDCRLTKIGQKR